MVFHLILKKWQNNPYYIYFSKVIEAASFEEVRKEARNYLMIFIKNTRGCYCSPDEERKGLDSLLKQFEANQNHLQHYYWNEFSHGFSIEIVTSVGVLRESGFEIQ